MTHQDKGHPADGRSSAEPTLVSTQNAKSGERPNPNATATDVKQKVSDDIRAASDLAKQEVAKVSDKAKHAAAEQKNFIADKMGGFALAIEKVAEELEKGDDRDIGRMTRHFGSSMRKFSEDIQDQSLGEIVGMAEDFGRKQPLAFLSMAAVAGLAASRFLKASAPHHEIVAKPGASAGLSNNPAPNDLTRAARTTAENRFNG